MADPAMVKLMRRLLRETRFGKISWSETDSENEYVFSAAEACVKISSHYSSDEDFYIQFCLINSQDRVAASVFTDNEKEVEDREGISINVLLNSLLEAVSANANDFHNALRDIYQALGGDAEADEHIFEL